MTTGFASAATAGPDDLLTVDLTGVGFLGATGLTALVNGTAAAAGGDLCVVARTRVVLLPVLLSVLLSLTVTGLDRVFDISPGLANALLGAGAGSDG